ncbi:MAG: NAD-dependent epimerase/dehydratase family protein [Paucibacter sp.]|nr:NAD-dependent epimerase/dehydratase family protein [Roseateles sp.]
MPKVLVCGVGGFIGHHIAAQLESAGFEVIAPRSSELDFGRMLEARAWLPRLKGVDAVVNAVGVLRDSPRRPMEIVHHRAPAALFDACAQAGVRRIVQVSALGIDNSTTLYGRSKRAADEHLLALQEREHLDATVLRPSIVFGRGGVSSQLFVRLARLPLLVLPAAALRARVQPVAVDDLAEGVVRLLGAPQPARLSAVGPRALTLADFIASLRQQLGHGAARVLALPDAPSRWSARLGDCVPVQPWCSETLNLLQTDNVDEAAAFAAVLGRSAIAPEHLMERAWR